jgi:hypothetical protein
MVMHHARVRWLVIPAAVLAVCGLARAQEDYAARTTVELPGTFREVTPSASGGHPDFGHYAADGAGRYVGIVQDGLDADGKPQFASTGSKVLTPWLDAEGVWVMPPRSYLASMPGDVSGSASATAGGAVTGASSFATWFRDVSGLTEPDAGYVEMKRDSTDPIYVFEGFLDDGGLLQSGPGAGATSSHTYEVDTTFIYDASDDQYIEVTTDGDVWLFVNGKLVLDGGAGDEIAFRGIAVDGPISLENSASIEVGSGDVSVSTNATADGSVSLSGNFDIDADVYSGPGSDPSKAIKDSGPGDISGSQGALHTAVQIPTPTPPAWGASSGNATFNNTNKAVASDMNVDDLSIEQSRLRFQGRRTVLVNGDLSISQQSDIEVEADSSVVFYVMGGMTVGNNTDINVTTGDPSLCKFVVLGSAPITLDNHVEVYANFIAPSANMDVGNNVDVYGAMFGESFSMSNSGHWVMMVPEGGDMVAGVQMNAATQMTQRIQLDRLGMEDGQTAGLKLFFADRSPPRSPIRVETNILTMKLAGKPSVVAVD